MSKVVAIWKLPPELGDWLAMDDRGYVLHTRSRDALGNNADHFCNPEIFTNHTSILSKKATKRYNWAMSNPPTEGVNPFVRSQEISKTEQSTNRFIALLKEE